MSGYVLDGIRTAMEPMVKPGWAACPCGHEGHTNNEAATWSLRFHYTHCPKARAADAVTKAKARELEGPIW